MISVFVVEDIPDIQFLLKHLFQASSDFLLLGTASNGLTALKMIPNLQPDVVLMDIGLPDISGIACIAQLKHICSKTEFVVFTVSIEDEDVFEALKVGATSYLKKTTPPKELLQSIREVHKGGSPISSDIARKIINTFATVQENKQRGKYGVSKREEEVLLYLSQGMKYQDAADKMFVSLSTLKSHIYNIYEKLRVNNKVAAINKYFGDKKSL